MTKENFTMISVILDSSGSMYSLAADSIKNFNTFLSEQKAAPEEAAFTLCTFNTDYSLVHDFVKLAHVPELNNKVYKPQGSTALLDALGATINSVGAKLAALSEDERPSKVIFLIITDGQENASKLFNKAQIKSMIEHQTNTYNWNFIFMGSHLDAISDAAAIGINSTHSMSYDASSSGTHDLYKGVSTSLRNYRSKGITSDSFTSTVKKSTVK